MATIFFNSNGRILAVHRTVLEDQSFGVPPDSTGSIDFDAATNAATLADYLSSPDAYTCPNGILTKNGQAVTVNTPSQDYQTLSLVKQAITTLKGTENLPALSVIAAAILAAQNGTATNTQAQLALAVTMRLLGLLAQRLLNNGTLG